MFDVLVKKKELKYIKKNIIKSKLNNKLFVIRNL